MGACSPPKQTAAAAATRNGLGHQSRTFIKPFLGTEDLNLLHGMWMCMYIYAKEKGPRMTQKKRGKKSQKSEKGIKTAEKDSTNLKKRDVSDEIRKEKHLRKKQNEHGAMLLPARRTFFSASFGDPLSPLANFYPPASDNRVQEAKEPSSPS